MATSAQLLKAQEAGAEIRITIAGQPERETPAVKAGPVVTQEMIDALALLRTTAPAMPSEIRSALRTLFTSGVFAHIDAAAVKEAPKNIAARAKEARRESIQRAVGLKF